MSKEIMAVQSDFIGEQSPIFRRVEMSQGGNLKSPATVQLWLVKALTMPICSAALLAVAAVKWAMPTPRLAGKSRQAIALRPFMRESARLGIAIKARLDRISRSMRMGLVSAKPANTWAWTFWFPPFRKRTFTPSRKNRRSRGDDAGSKNSTGWLLTGCEPPFSSEEDTFGAARR